MSVGPIPPGEELNAGTPTSPRLAATVLLVRGGARSLEVLLVQRNPSARFMGGVWVFPGGAVDAHEGDGDPAHRLAAVREVEEETGVRLPDPQALVPLSRWITPTAFRIRFDTYFFLAELPDGQEVRVDAAECIDFGWFTPDEALRRHRAGELDLVLPTIRHLELLGTMASATQALESLRGREPELVEPRVVGGGEHARVTLPSPGRD